MAEQQSESQANVCALQYLHYLCLTKFRLAGLVNISSIYIAKRVTNMMLPGQSSIDLCQSALSLLANRLDLITYQDGKQQF